MKSCPYPVGELLPHESPMILLDEVIDYDATSLRAAVTITAASMFLEQDGVPAYIGLEYMAQACGAHAGVLAQGAGAPVRIGFLLGTRQYTILTPWFRIGERLTVSVNRTYCDDEMASFACRIDVDGKPAAEAELNVIHPRRDHPMLQARLSGV